MSYSFTLNIIYEFGDVSIDFELQGSEVYYCEQSMKDNAVF